MNAEDQFLADIRQAVTRAVNSGVSGHKILAALAGSIEGLLRHKSVSKRNARRILKAMADKFK